jgi:DNA-binding NarL/FixJ family response regulator
MEHSKPLPHGNDKPIRIILADDHRIVREYLRRRINAEPDMEVVAEAATGGEVLRQTRQLLPDIVIMNLSMTEPELNGIEVIHQLLSFSPWIRVIALSKHSDIKFVLDMFKSGASGYLLKNCSQEELIKAISAVTHKKTYISPGISEIVVKNFLMGG